MSGAYVVDDWRGEREPATPLASGGDKKACCAHATPLRGFFVYRASETSESSKQFTGPSIEGCDPTRWREFTGPWLEERNSIRILQAHM